MISISNLLGTAHDSIETAKEFVNPSQIIVTDNDVYYYVVDEVTYNQQLIPFDYKIVWR